ncbi:MAG: transposase [Chlamydiales bacterium]
MSTLPPHIISVLQPFATLFCTSKTWTHAILLFTGALLCRGGRTVCSALKTMGLSGEQAFDKYHKLLNRARWSTLQGSKILLQEVAGSGTETVVIAVDEHIERRSGKNIKTKGCYRDAVRSSKKNVVKCFGLKWITVMMLKTFSWHSRPFALPIMTILAPSEKVNQQAGKPHKTTIDWTIQLVKQLRRWLPNRRIILSTDGGFANAKLGWTAPKQKVHQITRLRLDARLFDFPPERIGPGRKAKKGQRLMRPNEMLEQPDINWQEAEVLWYGGKRKQVTYATFVCLWHVEGSDPLPARIVLLKDPLGEYKPVALMGISYDFSLTATEIIENFIGRWNQEVTHREAREHLGVETQRQWSDKAIARTTPVLFAMYTFVLLMADRLNTILPLKAQSTAWYRKENVTFSDALREVRKFLWRDRYFNGFDATSDPNTIFSSEVVASLLDQLAESA